MNFLLSFQKTALSLLTRMWEAFTTYRFQRALVKAVINPNAKCPACGASDGEIEYRSEYRKVLHTCHVCHAIWGESPIVSADQWHVQGIEEFLEEERQQRLEEAKLLKKAANS